MDISIKRNLGTYLVFESENVKVEDDIESREYKDGVFVDRDVSTRSINQFVSILEEMMYYRKKPYNGCKELIESLFDKMSPGEAVKLAKKLYEKTTE